MPVFFYRARNVAGEQVESTMAADSAALVAGKLQAAGYFPVSIEEFVEKKSWKERFLSARFNAVSRTDVVRFTRRLADSLKGGLPLARALKVLERQTENQTFKKITGEIRAAVEEGEPLSKTLRKYPALFPELYVGMVRAGESTGLLELVLTRLAEFNEKEEELEQRIKAALAYPLVMVAVGGVSILFLLTFVIPKFEVMFQDLGQLLPLPTRIMIFCSKGLKYGWWLYVPALAAGLFGARKFLATADGRMFVDRMKLKIPVLGSLIQKELISRFIRMLSILLANGVPILDALTLAKNSVGNRILAAEIDVIYKSVKEGRGLIEPIGKSKFFPPLVADMIAVGEETGGVEASFVRVADIYDREVEYAVKTLTSLLEPAIILAIGLMVAFIAMSMLLPVFQMSTIIR